MEAKTKVMYFDLETTGLDPQKNGVCQMSGIIEVPGKKPTSFDFKVRPFPDDEISEEALKINGRTREEIQGFADPFKVYKTLIKLFSANINQYDKTDKLTLIGYNVRFDDEFLREWFRKVSRTYLNNQPTWYGAWISSYKIDVFAITGMLHAFGYLDVENLKQETVANALGIKYAAHDSLEDINACKKVFLTCLKSMNIESLQQYAP